MPNIPGIEKVRTMKTTHSRSKPPNMDEPYIEMYMLNKEKERLENEVTRLDTRRGWIVGRLKEIERDMARLARKDKRVLKKRKFDSDATWVNPEEPKKPKIKTGWKIKILERKKQNF